MAKRPKKQSEKSKNAFLEALQFVGLVCKNVGPINETHLLLSNKWCVAFNGILSAGIKIEEEIYAAPNAELIVEALLKCKDQFTITQLDQSKLSVKSDKFKAIVPCIDPTLLNITAPDPPIAIIDDKFKIALEAVAVLTNENAQKVHMASVLLNGQSTIATYNGHIVFEYWHGIDLPTGLALPKAFVQAVSKVPKKLTKFGFTNSTATIYFEDDSWLRTQLYADQWPDVRPILECKSSSSAIPAGFWEGVAAVSPFSEKGLIYFEQDRLCSHQDLNAGASFDVPGIPRGPIFYDYQLELIKPWAETIDFLAPGQHGSYNLVFYGKNMRGLIAGRVS